MHPFRPTRVIAPCAVDTGTVQFFAFAYSL